MKICIMCDLHLPFDNNALQYDVFEWAVHDVVLKKPDCVLVAGDLTCDGDEAVYDAALSVLVETGIPVVYVPGNSDLRSAESRERVIGKASACQNKIGDLTVFAINDADGRISDEQMRALDTADAESLVFMHHPPVAHDSEGARRLAAWREGHPHVALFCGHWHRRRVEGATFYLPAMDPDKSIGESPAITYYDTESKTTREAYYFAPVPTDLYGYFGVSCYDTLAHVRFATENRLAALELRPNALGVDRDALYQEIQEWRRSGGTNLSVHLPDIGWREGEVVAHGDLDALISLAAHLGADRVTQHVPKISVGEVRRNPEVLHEISRYLAKRLDAMPHNITIGVENMHMTASEHADDGRRFGYIPEECLEFMQVLSQHTRHTVGINFDIGHARNNAPYSQRYPIGTWLSMLGEHVVGYHMHQVTYEGGVFENHMPITDVYGHLISYASFFCYWSKQRIAKAPVVFEMRPEGAYETTLATFARHRERHAFDLHSHTHYSFCGKDDPRELIETAIANGLCLLGISDHNYGIGERKAAYLREMRALKKEYADRITLLCGIEISVQPHLYDLKSAEEIQGYDYCLLEHISYDNSIAGQDLFAFCDGIGIRCGIAHTDLFAYCDANGLEYREFFGQMAEHGVFWEMNVSYDSIHGYFEHPYVADFMEDSEKQRIVRESGVYLSVGFDSHRCREYDGYKVHATYDFLKRKGIRTADTLFV